MLIGKLNQVGLVLSLNLILIRITLFNDIIVSRHVSHKSDNGFKTSFSNLVAVTDFDMPHTVE